MPLELWKSIFDWATIIFIALTVLTGAGALITGDKLGQRQEMKSQQFEKDLTDARDELGKQQVRAANAESALTKLQNDTADARTKQQLIETNLENQRERAANAERSLLELQDRIKDRRLSKAQHDQLVTTLRPAKTEEPTFVSSILFDGEGREYAKDINGVLFDAGWTNAAEPTQSTPGNLARPVGLILLIRDPKAVPNHAIVLFNALAAAHLNPTWGQMDAIPPMRVSILVGNKPLN